jgi:hypothetical protein
MLVFIHAGSFAGGFVDGRGEDAGVPEGLFELEDERGGERR